MVKELLNLVFVDIFIFLFSLLLFSFSALGGLLCALKSSFNGIYLSFSVSLGCILNSFLLFEQLILFRLAGSLLFELSSHLFGDDLTDELLAALAVLLLLALVHVPFINFDAFVLGVDLELGEGLADEHGVKVVLHAQGRHLIVFQNFGNFARLLLELLDHVHLVLAHVNHLIIFTLAFELTGLELTGLVVLTGAFLTGLVVLTELVVGLLFLLVLFLIARLGSLLLCCVHFR